MYSDRTGNLDSLLGAGRDPAPGDSRRADDRERLALALMQAKLAALQLKYVTEFLPALKDAARSFLQFRIAGAKAGAIYAQFDGSGLNIPAPAGLLAAYADLPDLVTMLLAAGLIDPNDVILTGIPNSQPPSKP